ncbi:hypothetical protein XACLE20_640002 [Xanthomonas citri pv. citri]|nr:hypothetical protein XACLE20_640002 [Xanthomonas citri pv. citri]CEH65505.1 hypothetical protein XACLD7_6220002 [Xanthomonas citri pv. citri]
MQITGGSGVAIRLAGWCVPLVLHRGIAQQARMWFWRTATEPQLLCGLPAGPQESVFAFGSGFQSWVDDTWLSRLLKQRRGPTQRIVLGLDQFRLERAWVRSRQFVVRLPPRRRLGWMRDGLGHPWKASGDGRGAKRNAGHGEIRTLNVPLALAQLVADARCRQAMTCDDSLLSNSIALRSRCGAPARSGRLERERRRPCQRRPNTALWNVHQAQAVE